MASAITHFVVGASLALPVARSKGTLLSAGWLAVAPDLDTYLTAPFDIPRGTFYAHRGFFHSAFFLTLFCTALAIIFVRRPWRSIWPVAVLWSICAITHPLL